MPTTQSLDFAPSSTPTVVVPVSGAAAWVTAIAAGGLTVLDSSSAGQPLLDPSAIPNSSGRPTLVRPDHGGTTLRVAMVWHEDDQPVSTFRIRVFGAMTSTEGLWTVLPNMAGEDSVEIAVGSNDPYEIAEFSPPARMTIPDRLTHAWDSRGFKYFLIGIERVYAVVGGGDASAAYLLAKIV